MMDESRFTSLEREQEDDDTGHHTVYQWEKSIAAWNEAEGEDEDLINQELLSHRALEREKLRKAKLRRITPSIRRGLIRFLFIALDCSSSAEVCILAVETSREAYLELGFIFTDSRFSSIKSFSSVQRYVEEIHR
jgi:hypothetical protein